jgi:hypothetical protein
VFLGDGASLAKVAREGDADPDGVGSFADFEADPMALNDAGQVGYFFELADGREGIALWKVPEPGGISMLVAGILLLIALPRTRRRRSACPARDLLHRAAPDPELVRWVAREVPPGPRESHPPVSGFECTRNPGKGFVAGRLSAHRASANRPASGIADLPGRGMKVLELEARCLSDHVCRNGHS